MDIKGYEAHVFGHIGYKVYGGWVAVESDSCETPVHETTWEDINSLLLEGCEIYDDIFPTPDNKPNAIRDADQPI